VRLSDDGGAIIAQSACLAEALLAKSGMAVSELGQLRDLVRSFRTKVAA
jgi:hypothetical protein